jgi:hypothetical protein
MDAAWANQWFIDCNTKLAATNPSGPATFAAQVALITAYQQAQGRAVDNGECPTRTRYLTHRPQALVRMRGAGDSAGRTRALHLTDWWREVTVARLMRSLTSSTNCWATAGAGLSSARIVPNARS